MDEAFEFPFGNGDWIYVPDVKNAIAVGQENIPAKVITAAGEVFQLPLVCSDLTEEERLILQEGCLINYYAAALPAPIA